MTLVYPLLLTIILSAAITTGSARAQEQHFHPKGKPPSNFTIDLQNGLRATLPFEDRRDFEEAKKGFIAAPNYKQNNLVYDSKNRVRVNGPFFH